MTWRVTARPNLQVVDWLSDCIEYRPDLFGESRHEEEGDDVGRAPKENGTAPPVALVLFVVRILAVAVVVFARSLLASEIGK